MAKKKEEEIPWNWELIEFLKKEVHYLLEIRGLQKELLNK